MPSLRSLTAPEPGTITRVLPAIVVFLAAWGMTHFWFFPPHFTGDVPLYESYAHAVRSGQIPFRDYSLEYPPGALPAFLVPALPGHAYATWFEWLMAACGAGCIVLVALCRPSRFALPFLAVSPLLVGTVIRTHFDLWPTLLVVGAIASLLHDRHRLAFGLLAGAFAAKMFAAVLLPVAIVWTLRRGGRRLLVESLAIGAAVVAVATLPFAALAPRSVTSTVVGQITRPLQIETLAGSVLMTFAHPEIKSSHLSKSLPNHGGLAALTTALLIVLLAALCVGFARGAMESERLTRYAAACLCAFLAFGKITSPQFLIWLVPVVPLVRGRRGLAATAILAASLITTQVWFPDRYLPDYAWAPQLPLAWVVFARNLILVALFLVVASPSARALPDSPTRRAASTAASAP